MADIVERLRGRADAYRIHGPSASHTANILEEAADTIERLKEIVRNEALEEAARACEVDWDSESKSYGRVFAAAIRGLIPTD